MMSKNMIEPATELKNFQSAGHVAEVQGLEAVVYDGQDNVREDEEKDRLLLEEDLSSVDVEALQRPKTENAPPKVKKAALIIWIILNILATIAIVFINKNIFDDPSFRGAQLSFAAFHFFITFITLHAVSTQRIGFFARKSASLYSLLPLAIIMSLNVILPNLSLAYSSITFYQTMRVLLTPVVSLLNYLLYQKTIPKQAACMLVPVCVGVAMVTYFDTKPGDASVKSTSFAGVIFASGGVLASSLYTVWIASFTQQLGVTSVQLLHNLAPVASVTLLYMIPFIDKLPTFVEVPLPRWALILLSGLCACIINLSQFIIIGGAGAVSSTVVGHSKTCLIVILGWIAGGRAVTDWSIVGCGLAILGIIAYSVVSMHYKKPINERGPLFSLPRPLSSFSGRS